MLGTSIMLFKSTLYEASGEHISVPPWIGHFDGSAFVKIALVESLRIAWKRMERTVILSKQIACAQLHKI